MAENELIPHLFRTEYRKIIAVLVKYFGFTHIEVAEDIAADTFLSASEMWGMHGLPENPVAWLYTVAKNKAKNLLQRESLFNQKIAPDIKHSTSSSSQPDIDLSDANIKDSQLQMIFAVCHPAIPAEAQIGLALRILCGFGITEIANAFLSNKETINKRLMRAKEKLRTEQVKIEMPPATEIDKRLESVLTTLYLLFNEGYYSASGDTSLREDLCFEAMRLTYLLLDNKQTNTPAVNALMALMCFQASRFKARMQEGEAVLYDDQDTALWDKELITRGERFLNLSSVGNTVSKYHFEAGIAYWHTIKTDSPDKWEHILQLYNNLLIVEYSPIAALNRTYALAKANSKQEAITEAEKLKLENNHLYHALLGELYTGINNTEAKMHFNKALQLALSSSDKKIITKKIEDIPAKN
ncbi:MAG: RNA polymerase subunit sigma [Bacteroidetes bacterium]|nr:RNA polymerase subunit sigma [Bacteroidota bacterium]